MGVCSTGLFWGLLCFASVLFGCRSLCTCLPHKQAAALSLSEVRLAPTCCLAPVEGVLHLFYLWVYLLSRQQAAASRVCCKVFLSPYGRLALLYKKQLSSAVDTCAPSTMTAGRNQPPAVCCEVRLTPVQRAWLLGKHSTLLGSWGSAWETAEVTLLNRSCLCADYVGRSCGQVFWCLYVQGERVPQLPPCAEQFCSTGFCGGTVARPFVHTGA